jgi:predicted transcriptional regulator
MVKKWGGYYQERVLSVLPVDGTKVRSKDIYDKSNIPRAYVAKYLNELREKGFVEKIQESRKSVYYKRCEKVRLEAMLYNFIAELQTAFSNLPEPELDFKMIWAKSKMGYIPNEFTNDVKKSFLKGYILTLLMLKANELLRSIPELKNIEYYIKITESDLQFCPVDKDSRACR